VGFLKTAVAAEGQDVAQNFIQIPGPYARRRTFFFVRFFFLCGWSMRNNNNHSIAHLLEIAGIGK
jgi:hypothetical protein